MRIVVYTSQLVGQTGGEINVRDWALGLKRRGHDVVAYAPVLGDMAENIRHGGVAVVGDPGALTDIPDVAFGSGVNEIAALAARFPAVPFVQVSQQWDSWASFPSPLPQVVLRIAVDALNAESLANEFGVPRERIRMVYNAVDLARLHPRASPLPQRPERALVFVKQKTTYVDAVLEACAIREIGADLVGPAAGAEIADPLAAMAACDLVVGSARLAIEAAVSGAAVLVADHRGLGGLLGMENIEHFRVNNFGRAILTGPLDLQAIGAELDRYDPAAAASVSCILQEVASLDRQLDQLEGIFSEAIVLFRKGAGDAEDRRRALASYLSLHLPRHGEPSPRHPRHAPPAEPPTDRRLANLTRRLSAFRDGGSSLELELALRRIHQNWTDDRRAELASSVRNLVEHSESFDQYFAVCSIATIERTKRGHAGKNAYLIAAIGERSEHYIQHELSESGGALTLSFEAREAGAPKIRVQLLDGEQNGVYADFDFHGEGFSLGRVARATRVNGGVASVGDGWYKLWITAVLPSQNGRLIFIIQLADGQGQLHFTPEGESVLVRAIQLERGQLPSPYRET